MRRILAVPALLLVLAACTAPSGDDGASPEAPTAGPTLTVPGLEVHVDLEEFLSCLSDGGIDVEPEDDPRHGAAAELELRFEGEGGERTVEIFLFGSADDASAALTQIRGDGDGAPQQVGNVVVTGLVEAVQDPDVTSKAGVIVACLSSVGISPSA